MIVFGHLQLFILEKRSPYNSIEAAIEAFSVEKLIPFSCNFNRQLLEHPLNAVKFFHSFLGAVKNICDCFIGGRLSTKLAG